MLSKNTPEPDSNGDEVLLFIVSTLAPRLPVILGPNITGHFTNGWEYCTVAVINPTGAFYTTISTRNQANPYEFGHSTNPYDVYFDASRSNSIFNKSQTIQPLSLVLNHVIKY
nr:MAG TPA: hypothetical protein [Caudoviricetes sp.]